MKDKINKVFIFSCLLMLFIPLILVCMRVKVDDPYSEKKINGNFKRNFPLKDDYYSLYALLKTKVFHTDALPNKVIELKKGWLFLGDDYSDNFSESKGLKVFSKAEIDTLETNLIEKNNWLKENGIDYYLAIAPAKETVYANLIAVKKKAHTNSKREQIDSLCQKINVNYIDLSASFPKNSKQDLYFKTDTHWNEYGGFFGYLSIMKKIKSNHLSENLNPMDINDFEIDSLTETVGDLNGMAKREKTERFLILKYVNKNTPKSWELKKKLKLPDNYEDDPIKYERRFGSKANNLKILLLTDSFGAYTNKFLREHFGEAVFVSAHTFDKAMIKKEKPDIIIQEFVERNVDFLKLKKN